MTVQPNPPDLPDYDWEGARKKLIVYFSRRGLMNAPDLAQDTLTRLVSWLRREGSKIEGENGFMKTVFGFARFVRLEALKTQRHSPDELPEELPANTISTMGLNSLEAAHFLRGLLQQLADLDRRLILAAEEGIPQSKLATEMNMPLSTLRVKIYRAREKLRKLENSHGDT